MLARGAAAEIVAGNEDLGVLVGRLVEHEIRVQRAVLIVAGFREKARAEAGALDRLQVVLRNDHVGVDVDDRQRGSNARELDEFVHGLASNISRHSFVDQRLVQFSAEMKENLHEASGHARIRRGRPHYDYPALTGAFIAQRTPNGSRSWP